MYRDEVVVGEVEAQLGHGRGEPGEGRLAQFGAQQRLPVQVRRAGEGGVVAVGGEPDQPYRVGRLGGVPVVLVDAEAEPSVVGHETGMTLGHRGLDGLEVGRHQLRRAGQRPVQLVRQAGEGGRDLLEVDRQDPVGEAERVTQVEAEVDRVQRQRLTVPVPADALRVDVPVLQGHHPGREPVPDRAGGGGDGVPAAAGGVGGRALRFGGEQPLVAEFGQRLAYQQAVGPLPGFRAQVGDRVRRGHGDAPSSRCRPLRSRRWRRGILAGCRCSAGRSSPAWSPVRPPRSRPPR